MGELLKEQEPVVPDETSTVGAESQFMITSDPLFDTVWTMGNALRPIAEDMQTLREMMAEVRDRGDVVIQTALASLQAQGILGRMVTASVIKLDHPSAVIHRFDLANPRFDSGGFKYWGLHDGGRYLPDNFPNVLKKVSGKLLGVDPAHRSVILNSRWPASRFWVELFDETGEPLARIQPK